MHEHAPVFHDPTRQGLKPRENALPPSSGPTGDWVGWKWLSQLRRRKGRPRKPAGAPPCRGGGHRGRVLCVASGKGGTGKSVFSTNLAVYLARKGYSTVLFDADLGLANAHLILGTYPGRNLSHVVMGIHDLESVLETGPYGLQLLSGGTGISEMASLGDSQIYQIASQVELLEERYDYVVIDTAAGISLTTMAFLYSASESVVVTTPDITAMTDAYALLKTLVRHHPGSRTWILANRTRRQNEGPEVFRRIQSVTRKYLNHAPRFLGTIPDDPLISASIARRRPFILTHPRTPTSRAFLEAARTLRREAPVRPFTDLPTDRVLPLFQPDTSR